MYGKKGDPKHSSASLNARRCCFPPRRTLWAAADMQFILRVRKMEKAKKKDFNVLNVKQLGKKKSSS